MTKRLIIILYAINLFLMSCTSDSTSPFDIEYFILLFGGGSVIEKEKAITDSAQISDFLNKHEGIYYSKYEDESLDLRYIIENDKIYTGYNTEVTGTRTLFGTKLQIYIPGKTTGTGYDKNDEMFTFNFATNQNIYLFANAIFHKDSYSIATGYSYKIGEAIEELKQYSGNYYYYDYDDTKKYYILIDANGQIYIDDNLNITYSTASIKDKVLTITYTKTGETKIKQELHFYDDKLIFGNSWINDQLQYEALKRYDLFSPYNGTYTGKDGTTDITLTVTSNEIKLSTLGRYDTFTPVMSGNTLILYQYSSRYPTKEYKFVFNNDKVTYTKPDNGGTVILYKQS
ncbi:hypothetical protein [Brachyspira sp. SAP_772]|uniref:hypothetical protein n=1 Tax=Brachyspira sp. SAP_772 TaxID=2608385 RepID=UPI0012F4E12C|nr:hypothetical protein [Brachyspira sp. SAP_772]